MIRTLACVGVLLGMLAPTAQQRPPAGGVLSIGTGQIGGTVTTPAESGAELPVRRALIRLSMGSGTRTTVTDDRGRFLFTDLSAGRYTIVALRDGFISTSFGPKQSGPQSLGSPIALGDGQRELGLKISMPRGGVITGVITDPQGHPLPGQTVSAWSRETVNGVLTLTGRSNDMTDDEGAYRIFGLPAGSYVLSVSSQQLSSGAWQTSDADVLWAMQPARAGVANVASPPPVQRQTALVPTYYPGTVDILSAGTVTVEAGRERAGVSMPVRFGYMSRIAGVVTRPDGRTAPAGMGLSLDPEALPGISAGLLGAGQVPARAIVGADGAFEFSSVAPGRYAITTLLGSDVQTLWLKSPLTVTGEDVTGLALVLSPAGEMHGRVVVEASGTAAPDLTKGMIVLSSTGTRSMRTSPAADGTFTIGSVIPGSYWLNFSMPGVDPATGSLAWTMKSATVAGRTVTDQYFEIPSGKDAEAVITLSDRIASLSGKLIDRQNTPATDFFVLLIPVDRSKWLPRLRTAPRSTRPASDGTFRFGTVSPGEYYVAASTDFDVREILNTEYIEQFIAAAIKLTIAEGEKKVQDLRIGG